MSEIKGNYTKPQFYILLLLRLIIGYHFLFEGVSKLFNPAWSAVGFLSQSNWILSDLFISIANSTFLLAISDFLNIWGQILIGLSLLIGLFSRYAAIAGAVLVLLYYVAYPPFIEGYTFVDRNLLEFFGLLIVMLFQTSYEIGIDGLLEKAKRGNDE